MTAFKIFRGSSMVEQLPIKQWVAGSSPALGVPKIKTPFMGVFDFGLFFRQDEKFTPLLRGVRPSELASKIRQEGDFLV